MPYVLIRHKVRNFAKWKPLYDAQAQPEKQRVPEERASSATSISPKRP